MTRRTLLLAASLLLGCGTDDGRTTTTEQTPARTLCAADETAGARAEGLEPGQRFPGVRLLAGDRSVTLREVLGPCTATTSARLVVRLSATWCGTCRAHASATSSLVADGDVQVVDVLVSGGLDERPSGEDIALWSRRVASAQVHVLADADLALRPYLSPAALPRVVELHPGTLQVLSVSANPDPDTVARRPTAKDAWIDGRFTPAEWRLLQEANLANLRLPPDPTNAVADDPRAAALGKVLFALPLRSAVSCASCHQESRGLASPDPVAAQGVGQASRNVPSLLLAAFSSSQLWDGRADTLWMQATQPFEDPREMASSRLEVAHVVHARQRSEYEALFGPMPPLDDLARFPASGRPGDATWQSMTEADRAAIDRVFVHVAKSLAAFERTLRVARGPFDHYLDGKVDALSNEQKDGLAAFVRAGCMQCHYGPRLTDDGFHVLRAATGRSDLMGDPGRAEADSLHRQSEFTAGSLHSDDPAAISGPRISSRERVGAFKTPTLRAIASTAPYTHGGAYASLRDVVELHRTGGLPLGSRLTVGTTDPWLSPFSEADAAAIVRFLATFRAE